MKYSISKIKIVSTIALFFVLPFFAHAQYVQVNFGLNDGGLQNGYGAQNNYSLIHGSGLQNNGGLYNNTNFVTNTTVQNSGGTLNSGGLLNSSNNGSTGTCNNNFQTFADIMYFLACLINRYMIGIAVSLATIYTIWGILKYTSAPDTVEERTAARQIIIWGVFSMFIIISVWGIIQFFRSVLGV